MVQTAFLLGNAWQVVTSRVRPEASPEVEVVPSHPFFFGGGNGGYLGVETYSGHVGWQQKDVSEMDRLEKSIKFMCGRTLEKGEAT